MRSTLLSSGLLAALAASALTLSSLGAAAAKPAGSAAVNGNTASALLSQSTNQGPTLESAGVDLLLGLNFVTPQGMPSLPQFILDTVTPHSPYYHKYLTPQQFDTDYVQPAAASSALEQYLEGS